MRRIAVNLEWMFTGAGDGLGARVRAAAAAGVGAVEVWGWRSRDLDEFEAALHDTGVQLVSMLVDPQFQLTDPGTHEAFLDALRESATVARRLGAPNLVVLAGDERPGGSRADQHDAVVAALRRAAVVVADLDVTVLLENLNDRVDHPGTFLSSAREGLDVVAEVGSPKVRLLLDAYHCLVMGEDPAQVVGTDVALVGHVQVADVPGRHEPGAGTADWPAVLGGLRRSGYRGRFGLECRPTGSSVDALDEISRVLAQIDSQPAPRT